VLCKVGFESLCKFTPRQHDTPSTAFAFESDIRAETCDSPFIGSTWMLFSEAKMVVEAQVGKHNMEIGG
jgi:hypothetical protein